jgi:hypothetical protein
MLFLARRLTVFSLLETNFSPYFLINSYKL